ncbi:MAG: hypothetical protein U0X20_14565 [Caldilineaceae bacterium]
MNAAAGQMGSGGALRIVILIQSQRTVLEFVHWFSIHYSKEFAMHYGMTLPPLVLLPVCHSMELAQAEAVGWDAFFVGYGNP